MDQIKTLLCKRPGETRPGELFCPPWWILVSLVLVYYIKNSLVDFTSPWCEILMPWCGFFPAWIYQRIQEIIMFLRSSLAPWFQIKLPSKYTKFDLEQPNLSKFSPVCMLLEPPSSSCFLYDRSFGVLVHPHSKFCLLACTVKMD